LQEYPIEVASRWNFKDIVVYLLSSNSDIDSTSYIYPVQAIKNCIASTTNDGIKQIMTDMLKLQ
jgi:hypothetical protein